MNKRAGFDVGPLTWVKGEIDTSIERAREALRGFAAEGADESLLKASQAHLHQARGALLIVGLDGVTRVAEELEGLLADLARDAAVRSAESYAVAERGFEAIGSYLNQLVSGAPNQTLRLLEPYRDLVAARGNGVADATDLYYPDLSLRPPHREKIPVLLHPEEREKYLHEQTSRYQRGFLRYLRGDRAGAADMRAAVEAIELTQGMTSQRAFWWVALAFLDALEAAALPEGLDPRQLCKRIEEQLRRLSEGSQNVAERLMREALYFVAHARAATDQLRQVQEAYQLARTLPRAETAKTGQAAAAAREGLARARDAWNRYASGDSGALPAYAEAIQALEENSSGLQGEEYAQLARELSGLAQWLAQDPKRMSEAVALEGATALLLFEAALDDGARVDPEMAQQAALARERLDACRRGTLLRTQTDIPLFDEMSRRAQDRLLVSQVAAQIQSNLRAAEQVLDSFFRDPGRRAELASLQMPLHQALGAFEMLGEARAKEALSACVESIRRLESPQYRPQPGEFESIAQTFSGLGFYVEALARGEADFDAAMRPIGAAPAPAESPAEMPGISVESELGKARRSAQHLIDQWKRKPTDTQLKAELQRSLAAIREDAGIVADAALAGQAQAALQLLEKADAMPLEPAMSQALETIAPAAPAPTPEAARLLEASAEHLDAELLAVFLEEADEVLAGVAERAAQLRADARNQDALTVIRRGFHTLKGSGRMVGLARLGEAAWAVEQALNQWLATQRAATPELLELIGAALGYFGENVARLKSGGASSDESELVARAAALARAEEVEARPPAPTAAAPAVDVASLALEAPAPAAEPAGERVVQLGGESVSASLFAIFSGEARHHMGSIRQEHQTLIQHGVVTDELLRAAHTLASISATVKLKALNELGRAFEHALEQLAATALSEDEEALIGEAIDRLESMVEGALELRAEPPAPELVGRLASVAAAAMLPEEEGALARAEPEPGAPEARAAQGEAAAAEAPVERRQRRLEDDLDRQLLPVFLEEAHELVPAIGAAIRDWRAHPGQRALGESLQRLLHTIKGSARMAGAMSVGELTHRLETHVEQGLAAGAPAPAWFEELQNSHDRLCALHDRLQQAAAGASAPAAAAGRAGEPPPRAVMRVRAEVVDRLVSQAGEVSIARVRIESEMRSVKAAMRELTDNVARLRSQLREIEIQAESQMQSRLKEVQDARGDFDPLELDRFTRSHELARLMAESVEDVQTVHQNLVQAMAETEAALAAQARLNRELSHELMRVRMVPFSSVAERLHRIVRQTARESGVRANLEIRGSDVELDRSVLERMIAPLEHLLRNAVIHGIEPPEERARKSKREIGEVRLEAAQEGNEARLALADDGRGLDLPAIRARAVAMGLIAERAALADADLAELIYQPGLTTAGHLTQVAGRGVGMDVVKSEVAALGGRIEIAFEKDRGTRFTVYLPVTLAVTHVVLVKSQERTYAIPAVLVEQVLQLRPEQILEAYRARQAEWRSRRLPFHYLPHLLGAQDARAERRRLAAVLVLRSGASAMALHVDDMAGGNQEIVIKATGPQLARIRGVTGATVLGSGEIVLILNPVALAPREAGLAAPAAPPEHPPRPAPPTVMVVDDSLTVRKITGRLLERNGYRVVTARDGVEAVEKLAEELPEVMLIDIEMPRMDGFELTRNLRAQPRTAKIPVIMITSRAADKHQNHAREIGADHYLGKPYQEEELLAHVARFVAARRGV